MRLSRNIICSAVVLGFFGSNPAVATTYGFFDNGFVQGPGIFATDYYNNIGASNNPLTTSSCIFSAVNPTAPRCGLTHNFTFNQANYWNQNWPPSCAINGRDGFGNVCTQNWIVMFNNDTSFNNASTANAGGFELYGSVGSGVTGNSGPPDASYPQAQPNNGLFGFSTYNYTTLDNVWRANLSLDLAYNPNTTFGQGSLPWLGFGAIDWGNGLGNGHPIGALNPTSGVPSILHFGTHLWDANLAPTPSYGAIGYNAYVYILTKWGSVPKWIGVVLYHNNNGTTTLTPNSGFGATNAWNWPFPQSAMYPGAQLSEIMAESIPATCGDTSIINTTSTSPAPVLSLNSYPQHEVNYTINVQKLFNCANAHGAFSGFTPAAGGAKIFNEPLPATANIPIYGVLWAVEGAGLGGGDIFLDVHQMSMLTN